MRQVNAKLAELAAQAKTLREASPPARLLWERVGVLVSGDPAPVHAAPQGQ